MARPGRRFAMFMARTLGRTVDELADSMSGQEYGEWMALYAIERAEREGQGAAPPVEEEMDLGEFLARTQKKE